MVLENFTNPYTDIEAWAYDTFIADALTAFMEKLNPIWESFSERPVQILDVGCGGGQNAKALLSKLPQADLTGIDLSASQIERARQRNQPFSNRSRFVEGNALAMPFEDDRFDVVYSVASIKHWPSPRLGLKECVRVLKPNGTLVIIEANRSATWDECLAFVRQWNIPELLQWPATLFFQKVVAGQAFTKEEMESFLTNLPLKETSVTRIEGLPGLVIHARKNG